MVLNINQIASPPSQEASNHSAQARQGAAAGQFLPLAHVTRPTVETAAAAFYLNRREQTLRAWACLENGPIRPLRINGRLAWPVAELRRVLGV